MLEFKHKAYIDATPLKWRMRKVSLEQFVEDCRTIQDLVAEAVQDRTLPYVSMRGLGSGVQIIDDIITYFFKATPQRNSTEYASMLQRAEFGLQTLRDSCEIAEEECGEGKLPQLREIINQIGEYSIKTGDLRYSFSRVVIPSGKN